MVPSSRCKKAVLDGLFYSSSADDLAKEIGSFIGRRSPLREGRLLGLLCPHGSYKFTGEIVGKAMAAIDGDAAGRFALISTVHREREEAVMLPGFSRFDGPGWNVDIDGETVGRIFDSFRSSCLVNDIPFEEETSVEPMLPFLSYIFRDCPDRLSIVPLLLGDETPGVAAAAAAIVSMLNDLGFQFVIITNLLGTSAESGVLHRANLHELDGSNANEFTNGLIRNKLRLCSDGAVRAFFEGTADEDPVFIYKAGRDVPSAAIGGISVFYCSGIFTGRKQT